MADAAKPRSGGGCFTKLIIFILLLGGAGLGTAVFFAAQPQDLTTLGGYGPAAATTPAKDMKSVLKSSIERGYPVTLTEADLNHWLGRTVKAKQGGLLESQVSLDRVWVRLEQGVAEVIMERRIMGHPMTVSMFLQVEQLENMQGVRTEVLLHGGPYHPSLPNPPRGGRFGQLVVPQGFLILVMPAFQKLTAQFSEEIDLGFKEMARIRVEKGRLVLDPRDQSSTTF